MGLSSFARDCDIPTPPDFYATYGVNHPYGVSIDNAAMEAMLTINPALNC
jgi:hypothetical protein